jgi:hypothetical protein
MSSAAARRRGATSCAAMIAARPRSATTLAATGTARSARVTRPGADSMHGRLICCRSSITTWSSRCPRPSPMSRTVAGAPLGAVVLPAEGHAALVHHHKAAVWRWPPGGCSATDRRAWPAALSPTPANVRRPWREANHGLYAAIAIARPSPPAHSNRSAGNQPRIPSKAAP